MTDIDQRAAEIAGVRYELDRLRHHFGLETSRLRADLGIDLDETRSDLHSDLNEVSARLVSDLNTVRSDLAELRIELGVVSEMIGRPRKQQIGDHTTNFPAKDAESVIAEAERIAQNGDQS